MLLGGRHSRHRGLVLVAWLGCALAAGCAPPEPPRTRAEVEAIFDVPREYRMFGSPPCAEGAGLVYVVSARGELYSFRPDALEFRRIGPLRCSPAHHATPNSMAVDRSGTAWVNYSDGSLFRVSTRDASCAPTEYTPRQHGFQRLGMAFASSGPDLAEETLFVWGGDSWSSWPRRRGRGRRAPLPGELGARRGLGLARIDLDEHRLLPIGDDRGPLSTLRAELTGTGAGKLFGFFSTRPATLAEIDPATGATSAPRPLESVFTGRAWAFSFWGGDFWFYWALPGGTSNVSQLSGHDGAIQQVLADIGFLIVGAGVSTCAPTGPSG